MRLRSNFFALGHYGGQFISKKTRLQQVKSVIHNNTYRVCLFLVSLFK
jgi:arginine/lysine/ornithine decarboxylase